MTENRERLEYRRLQALQDFARGLSQAEIARRHNVSRATACRWMAFIRNKKSLLARPAPGRPRRMDWQLLVPFFQDQGKSWRAIAEQIKTELGVSYDPDHIGRVAHAMGVPPRNEQRKHGQSTAMQVVA